MLLAPSASMLGKQLGGGVYGGSVGGDSDGGEYNVM